MLRKLLLTTLVLFTLFTGVLIPHAPHTASLWPWDFFKPTPTSVTTQKPAPTAAPSASVTVSTPTAPPSVTPAVNAPTAAPSAPTTTTKTLISSTKIIRGITYRIELNQVLINNRSDGYQVSVYKGAQQLSAVNATKTQATKIYNTIQKYKPTTSQMLIARILVLALL